MEATERATPRPDYTVYLNGIPQVNVVEANAVEGWLVFETQDGNRLTRCTRFGVVRIEYGDETGG